MEGMGGEGGRPRGSGVSDFVDTGRTNPPALRAQARAAQSIVRRGRYLGIHLPRWLIAINNRIATSVHHVVKCEAPAQVSPCRR